MNTHKPVIDISEYTVEDAGVCLKFQFPNPGNDMDARMDISVEAVRVATQQLIASVTLEGVVGPFGCVELTRPEMTKYRGFADVVAESVDRDSLKFHVMEILMSSISTVTLRRFENAYRGFLKDTPAVEPTLACDREALATTDREICTGFMSMVMATGHSLVRSTNGNPGVIAHTSKWASAARVMQIHEEWVKLSGPTEMFDANDAARLADFVISTPNTN